MECEYSNECKELATTTVFFGVVCKEHENPEIIKILSGKHPNWISA